MITPRKIHSILREAGYHYGRDGYSSKVLKDSQGNPTSLEIDNCSRNQGIIDALAKRGIRAFSGGRRSVLIYLNQEST